jgi:hypothetical protein
MELNTAGALSAAAMAIIASVVMLVILGFLFTSSSHAKDFIFKTLPLTKKQCVEPQQCDNCMFFITEVCPGGVEVSQEQRISESRIDAGEVRITFSQSVDHLETRNAVKVFSQCPGETSWQEEPVTLTIDNYKLSAKGLSTPCAYSLRIDAKNQAGEAIYGGHKWVLFKT